jgi:nucleoside-diphosphate-sugar epimerase
MRILVTGANGFIGSNIITQLTGEIKNVVFYAGTKHIIDLYSQRGVSDYIDKHKIDTIIHCAINGGKHGIHDTSDVMYKNLLMFENLISNHYKIKKFINIASGAEYDKRESFIRPPWTKNQPDKKSVPIDYYGLSKYIISERMRSFDNPNFINLRLFGCFGKYENKSRMIRRNIENYIKGDPIIIHQDGYMDFFYVNDFVKIISFYLTVDDHFYKSNPSIFWRDMDLTYYEKLKLSDIANIINNLSDKKVPIVIEDKKNGNSYCGYSPTYAFPLKFIGLENGIKEFYQYLLKNNE